MLKLYVCEISNLIKEVQTDATVLATYFDKLGEARIEQLLKYNRAEDKARGLGAAYLLLFALHKEGVLLEMLPDFSYEEKGKPYLEEVPQFHFNLSHTKNMVVCAISEDKVGVDIEHIREINDSTIQRIFTEKEREIAGSLEDGFVRLWTMKEACAKLRGSGLTDILDGMELCSTNNGFVIKKLNQDIRKTFCYPILAEGKISDAYENPYYYSICTKESSKVEIIHTMWDKHIVIL